MGCFWNEQTPSVHHKQFRKKKVKAVKTLPLWTSPYTTLGSGQPLFNSGNTSNSCATFKFCHAFLGSTQHTPLDIFCKPQNFHKNKFKKEIPTSVFQDV